MSNLQYKYNHSYSCLFMFNVHQTLFFTAKLSKNCTNKAWLPKYKIITTKRN